MEALFENNKNRTGGAEKPFYIGCVNTVNEEYHALSHWHYHFELLYFTLGATVIWVGNKSFEIKAGELVLINPCEVHSLRVQEGVSSKHFVIGFDPEFILGVSEMDFDIKYLLPHATAMNSEARILKPEILNMVELDLELALKEYRSEHIGFELVIASVIYKLITIMLRSFEARGLILTSNSATSRSNLLNLGQILDYINEHYHQKITAEEAAERCFLSYSHFSKLFKKIMKTSFVDYLNHYRIGKAESLLLDSGLSITQIALDTGFSDTSYFIKQFKRYKGISPKHYQKIHGKIGN